MLWEQESSRWGSPLTSHKMAKILRTVNETCLLLGSKPAVFCHSVALQTGRLGEILEFAQGAKCLVPSLEGVNCPFRGVWGGVGEVETNICLSQNFIRFGSNGSHQHVSNASMNTTTWLLTAHACLVTIIVTTLLLSDYRGVDYNVRFHWPVRSGCELFPAHKWDSPAGHVTAIAKKELPEEAWKNYTKMGTAVLFVALIHFFVKQAYRNTLRLTFEPSNQCSQYLVWTLCWRPLTSSFQIPCSQFHHGRDFNSGPRE